MDSGLPLTQKGYKMATLEKAPTSNFWSTSLNGAINDSVTTITLNSTTGLQAPGRLVINRQDSTGKNTPSAREVISSTGISGSDLTGVIRGADNSTARSHADGSLVESAMVVGNWDALYKVIDQEHNTDGVHSVADMVTGGSVVDDDTFATASATTLATSESTKAYVDNGWIPVSETWTRTGNHTFTVSGNLTAKYRKGTKVRYKDGGSYEYGVIGSSSYSSPNTTITLITNNDYAMAAATITDTYISYAENPEGFPQIFSYTSTVGASGGTLPTFAEITGYWTTRGRLIHYQFAFVNDSGGTPGSGAYDIYCSLPIAIAQMSSQTNGFAQYASGDNNSLLGVWGNGSNIYFRPTVYSGLQIGSFSSVDRYLLGFIDYMF